MFDLIWGAELKELVEEGAVLNHGGAEVFGGGLVAVEADGDGVGGAVGVDDAGMVDGDVGGPLIEVGYGIAASVHEGGDELIGFEDGSLRVVDETGLNGLPIGFGAFAFGGGEVAKVEVFDTRLAGLEMGLGAAFGTLLEDGTVVLGAEALAQLCGGVATMVLVDRNGDDEDESDRN